MFSIDIISHEDSPRLEIVETNSAFLLVKSLFLCSGFEHNFIAPMGKISALDT